MVSILPGGTLPPVTDLYRLRRFPFAVAAAAVAIISVAIARLPDSFVNSIENNRPLTTPQAGWAYRLLAFAAVAQAVYGGFVVFRIDRVKRARERDEKVGAMAHEDVIRSLSRNAGGAVFLTLIYGIASFGITGERGGYWLFPVMCALQGAWYFREIGAVTRWLTFQPAAETDVPLAVWEREGPDYCPPLARGLVDRSDPEPGSAAQAQSA